MKKGYPRGGPLYVAEVCHNMKFILAVWPKGINHLEEKLYLSLYYCTPTVCHL